MNNTIFFFFYNLAHQSQIVDNIIVFFALYFPYILVFAAGIFLLMHHDIFRAANPFQVFFQKKKEILKVVFSGVLAYFIAVLLKNLFQIPRPFFALSDIEPLISKTTFSFPSEHTSIFMALSVLIFLLHKKVGYIFIFFTILIGIARIGAGVLFPAYILGGFVLGAVVAYLVRYF